MSGVNQVLPPSTILEYLKLVLKFKSELAAKVAVSQLPEGEEETRHLFLRPENIHEVIDPDESGFDLALLVDGTVVHITYVNEEIEKGHVTQNGTDFLVLVDIDVIYPVSPPHDAQFLGEGKVILREREFLGVDLVVAFETRQRAELAVNQLNGNTDLYVLRATIASGTDVSVFDLTELADDAVIMLGSRCSVDNDMIEESEGLYQLRLIDLNLTVNAEVPEDAEFLGVESL